MSFRKAADVCSFCNTSDDTLSAQRLSIRNKIRLHDTKGFIKVDGEIAPTIIGELRYAGYDVHTINLRPQVTTIRWTGLA